MCFLRVVGVVLLASVGSARGGVDIEVQFVSWFLRLTACGSVDDGGLCAPDLGVGGPPPVLEEYAGSVDLAGSTASVLDPSIGAEGRVSGRYEFDPTAMVLRGSFSSYGRSFRQMYKSEWDSVSVSSEAVFQVQFNPDERLGMRTTLHHQSNPGSVMGICFGGGLSEQIVGADPGWEEIDTVVVGTKIVEADRGESLAFGVSTFSSSTVMDPPPRNFGTVVSETEIRVEFFELDVPVAPGDLATVWDKEAEVMWLEFVPLPWFDYQVQVSEDMVVWVDSGEVVSGVGEKVRREIGGNGKFVRVKAMGSGDE